MKANKIALLSLTALLLIACGPTNSNTQTGGDQSSDVTTPDGSDTDTNTSTTIPEPDIDEEITLTTFGGMFMNSFRTIYATLKNGTEDEFVWESSNKSVAEVTPRTGMSSEGYVEVIGYGKTTITCYLASHPGIRATYDLNITEGEAMPEDLFNSFGSSARFDTDQYYYQYNSKFFEKQTRHMKMTALYEEHATVPGEAYAKTDSYYFKSWNPETSQVEKEFTYTRDPVSQNIAIEGQDIYNRVVYESVTNSEGESKNWDLGIYFNMLGNPDLLTREDFRTFDGGNTYHFTGVESQIIPVMNSLFLTNLSPDDFYFEKSGNNWLINVVSDPHNEIGYTTRYGVKLTSRISEIGTAKIQHYQVYEHLPYHDKIQEALDEVKLSNNYTVDVKYDFEKRGEDISYHITRDEKTINRVKYNEEGLVGEGGQRLIQPGKNGSYYSYNIKNGAPVKSEIKDGNFEDLLPNYYFAPEILKETGTNSYETISDMGFFVSKVAPLTMIFFGAEWPEKGTLTLTNDGKLDEVKSVAYVLQAGSDDLAKVTVSAKFSHINDTKIPYDFSPIDSDLTRKSWNDYPALAASLKEWKVFDILPFVDAKNGFSESINGNGGDVVEYLTLDVNSFIPKGTNDITPEIQAQADKENDEFQKAYVEALIAAGFEDNGDTDPIFGYKMYAKGSYLVGIGDYKVSWKPQPDTAKSRILVRSPLIERPTVD